MKLVALAAVVAALAVPNALAAGSSTSLTATVGPGFTISLTQGGKAVKTLKAGTYTIVVNDKSSIHNFHLTGPGLSKSTTVAFVGKQTWKLTLKKGSYKYVCDPHASIMHGAFVVK